MRKIYLFLFLILILPLVSSVIATSNPTLGTFKQFTEVDLIQGCTNSTSICGGCNITSLQRMPDSAIVISEVAMQKLNEQFNYTLLANQTNNTGDYTVNGLCFTDTEIIPWAYDFKITLSGEELTTAGGIVSVVFLIAILFVFSLTLWGAIILPWGHPTDPEQNIVSVNDWRFVKIFLSTISYVMLMFIFGIIKRLTEHFVVLQGASSIFNWLYWIMMSFLWPLIVLTIIIFFIVWLQNLTIKKKMRRGLRVKG